MGTPLHIDLGPRSYDIHIRAGALASAGTLIAQGLGADTRCLVISDATVAEHHAEALMTSLAAAGLTAELATFPAGEPNKSLASADALWQRCAAARIDRTGAVIALGGGVSGDLAGFVAASWMRGVRFVQVPTTLLAMVDSAVGGKTAVNSPAGKNLIGAFHQPSLVVADPLLLQTMGTREYRAGLAEVLKYGVIREPEFFAWQEDHATALVEREPAAVAEAVRRSCACKAWYVAADEREGGVRAHLNYGHTFGHALEGETGYNTYLHGEAVAIGMRMAAACAHALGMLADDQLIPRQDALLAAYGLPTHHQPAHGNELDRLVQRCGLDKKVSAGHTRFILPTQLGAVDLVTDPDPLAVAAGFRAGFAQ